MSQIPHGGPPRSSFRPKLFTTLKGYSWRAFAGDGAAGLVVGIVALPLAIAFAIASGVSPEKGLITAVVAGFLISALGGSRVQIGGPTGAFVVIVYGIVEKHGVEGLTVATFMAGILLVAMGLARFGTLIQFIPHPVTVGFTSGIAVIIASSQVRDFFGLRMESVPSEFFAKWAAFGRHAPTLNGYSLGLSAMGMAVLVFWPRYVRRIPGSLVALVLVTVLTLVFHLPVETIGSRFGTIPHVLPLPHLPQMDWALVRELIQPAMAIALLAGIESLLSATVADGMIGGRHRSNMELVAQGVANLVSPLFGGIPATGAIARTATNVKNGARTPVAGIVHSLVLLLIMLAFGRYAALIPLAGLSAILVVVAYNMSEWRTFRALLLGPRQDAVVLLVTFALTVAVDLTVAIEVGMIVAALLFMKQMSEAVHVDRLTPHDLAEGDFGDDLTERRTMPAGVEVYEINGPLFFGAAHKFEAALAVVTRRPRVLILRVGHLLSIDATGLHALEQVCRNCRGQGIAVLLCGARPKLLMALYQGGLAERLGEENLLPHFDAAMARATEIIEDPIT